MMHAFLDAFALPMPVWALAVPAGLALLFAHRLRKAERQLAAHARIFAALDGWAEGVDDCLEAFGLRQGLIAAEDHGGKVVPFPRKA